MPTAYTQGEGAKEKKEAEQADTPQGHCESLTATQDLCEGEQFCVTVLFCGARKVPWELPLGFRLRCVPTIPWVWRACMDRSRVTLAMLSCRVQTVRALISTRVRYDRTSD